MCLVVCFLLIDVRYVWIGDTGEMDRHAGELMARQMPDKIKAIFLHYVGDHGRNSAKQLPEDYYVNGVPIIFFRYFPLPQRMPFLTRQSPSVISLGDVSAVQVSSSMYLHVHTCVCVVSIYVRMCMHLRVCKYLCMCMYIHVCTCMRSVTRI